MKIQSKLKSFVERFRFTRAVHTTLKSRMNCGAESMEYITVLLICAGVIAVLVILGLFLKEKATEMTSKTEDLLTSMGM